MKEAATRPKGATLMTFDVNMSIDSQSPEGNVVESIMARDHVTPEEAIRRVLRGLQPAPRIGATPQQRRKALKAAPLTSEEFDRLKSLFPPLTALQDVPDETWRRISKGRMRTEGFPPHA